jgi:biotin carboxylase
MTLHVLGGGFGQLSLIRKIKELGYDTVVSDKDPKAPGFSLATYSSYASTFNREEVIDDAKRFKSDFFITAGTDQPVLTAALAANSLGKPFFLTPEQALMVTNKQVMKESLSKAGIANQKFVTLIRDFQDIELKGLTFPLVIKPLDSQGQRGVLKVHSIREIRDNINYVLTFSRSSAILAEEYYQESGEITVSAWCEKGKAYLLSVTDRVTINNGSHLGVCVAHRYPSLCHHDWHTIYELVQEISAVIGMVKGPLYIQILHGKEGYSVNEMACRLGGAYEDQFLPWLCGIPLLDYMIEMSAGREYNKVLLDRLTETRGEKRLSLEMFFYRPGTLAEQSGMDKIRTMKGVLGGDFLLKKGTEVFSRDNSTQRAGYFITSSLKDEPLNIEEAYSYIRAKNEIGQDLLCRF